MCSLITCKCRKLLIHASVVASWCCVVCDVRFVFNVFLLSFLFLTVGAKCCSFFSVTGFIFLIIIGLLLQKQPLYIKGPSDPAAAAMGCYEGGMINDYHLSAMVATFLF